MPQNIIDKIWERHMVQSKEGYPDVLAIDLQLLHEVTSPQAFNELRRRGLRVRYPKRCVATIDHNIATDEERYNPRDEIARKQIETLRKNCRDFGITLFDVDSGHQGIVHVIGPELGVTRPGMTIVCGDSHTATHGAFGALAFGVGTTEVGHVLATGRMLQTRPSTMKVHFSGRRLKGVTAKDMILKLIQTIGVGGATGYVIEYTGEEISQMSMEERMTICNMSIECGARAGLISPDQTTIAYLQERITSLEGEKWDKMVKHWQSVATDNGAKYDREIEINIADLSPMVTWGTTPAQVIEVDEEVPEDHSYTKLKKGQKIAGVPIDYVFIGSCTNGRYSDLAEAAKIFVKNKVNKNVKVYIVPGSEEVKERAEATRLKDIFEAAGAEFREPGCSMCLAMNADKVPAGKRCASTSNRNFVGRQGEGSITHLMSPIMAAAAAVAGEITDVRKFL